MAPKAKAAPKKKGPNFQNALKVLGDAVKELEAKNSLADEDFVAKIAAMKEIRRVVGNAYDQLSDDIDAAVDRFRETMEAHTDAFQGPGLPWQRHLDAVLEEKACHACEH